MYDELINQLAAELTQRNYLVARSLMTVECKGLLMATSKKMVHIGPVKFKNHYLFVDWDNELFGRLDMLLTAQKNFSAMVNKDYKVPHGWRMTLPNLALVALTTNGFSNETIECTLSRYFSPILGGEAAQIMLFDLRQNWMIAHSPPYYKQYGRIPLESAVNEISDMFSVIVPGGTIFRKKPA